MPSRKEREHVTTNRLEGTHPIRLRYQKTDRPLHSNKVITTSITPRDEARAETRGALRHYIFSHCHARPCSFAPHSQLEEMRVKVDSTPDYLVCIAPAVVVNLQAASYRLVFPTRTGVYLFCPCISERP